MTTHTVKELKAKIAKMGLKLPSKGSGKDGRLVKKDYEKVLNKSTKSIKSRVSAMIFNIDYYDEDGRRIVSNMLKDPKYKYVTGESGTNGTLMVYEVPKDKVSEFKVKFRSHFKKVLKGKGKIKFYDGKRVGTDISYLDHKSH